jgi:hypothetical protein
MRSGDQGIRPRVTLIQYMMAVSTAYLAVFWGIGWYVGASPSGSMITASVVSILAALFLGAVGTLRLLQMGKPSDPRFLFPTVAHLCTLGIIAVCAFLA